MERYIVHIKSDDSVSILLCERDEPPELELLQELVGGYIECAPTRLGAGWEGLTVDDYEPVMLVNEEGKLLGLDKNILATQLSGLFPLDVVVGDVAILGADGDELVGFTKEAALNICKNCLDADFSVVMEVL